MKHNASLFARTPFAAALASRIARLDSRLASLAAGEVATPVALDVEGDLSMALRRAPRVIAVEALGDCAVVSPPLGEGALCVHCWRLRRIAAWAAGRRLPEDLAGLGDSYRAATSPLHIAGTLTQLDALAALLARLLQDELLSNNGRPEPTTLYVIGTDGATRCEAVLPRPECAPCAARTAKSPLDRPFGDKLSNALIGRAAGVVVAVEEVVPLPGEPEFPYVARALLANTWLSTNTGSVTSASGKGRSRSEAAGSALGEAIERYAAQVVPAGALVTDSTTVRQNARIEPAEIWGLLDEQAAALNYAAAGEPVTWTMARSRRFPDSRVLVPAGAVYTRLPLGSMARMAGPFTTNGLACAPTIEAAIDAALAELVERDRFFAAWYGLAYTSSIEARTINDDDAAAAVAEFSMRGIVSELFYLGGEGGTQIVAARLRPTTTVPHRPASVVGLGRGISLSKATLSALLEAGQVYRGLTHLLRDVDQRTRAKWLAHHPDGVTDPLDHALFHSVPPPEASRDPLRRPRARSARVIATSATARDTVFVDLTPRDVASVSPSRVARVISSPCIPYHVGLGQIPRRILTQRAIYDSLTPTIHPLC